MPSIQYPESNLDCYVTFHTLYCTVQYSMYYHLKNPLVLLSKQGCRLGFSFCSKVYHVYHPLYKMVLSTPIPSEWSKEISDKYAPIRILGKGGFASVTLARRKDSEELVAIKVRYLSSPKMFWSIFRLSTHYVSRLQALQS